MGSNRKRKMRYDLLLSRGGRILWDNLIERFVLRGLDRGVLRLDRNKGKYRMRVYRVLKRVVRVLWWGERRDLNYIGN